MKEITISGIAFMVMLDFLANVIFGDQNKDIAYSLWQEMLMLWGGAAITTGIVITFVIIFDKSKIKRYAFLFLKLTIAFSLFMLFLPIFEWFESQPY